MNKKESTRLEEQAIENLRGVYHCSEAVLKVLADHYGIDADLLLRASNPFGGGIGDSDNLCGAVTGAIMAIGALITPEERQPPAWPSGQVAKQFMERYQKTVGSTNCLEIRHGLNWKDAHEYCDEAVRVAVKIAVELIDEYFAALNPT
ncbi:MAG: C-GCAxxG-C-C family protein [Candidatus Ranarchaeia archaeon]